MNTDTATFSPEEAPKLLAAPERPRWIAEISSFDGLEIHPVREVREEAEAYCEQCEPHEAQFWSVYGHLKEGGVLCLEDFESEAQARDFANRLLDEWPHLRTFGLLG